MGRDRANMLVLAAAGAPALAGAALLVLAAGPGTGDFPAAVMGSVIGLMGVLALLAALSGALSQPSVAVIPRAVREQTARVAEALRLPLTDRVVSDGRPATAGVIGCVGECPLALKQGERWDVSPYGKLNAPLCRPAVDAIDSLIRRRSQPARARPAARCVCPRGGQRVWFAIVS